MGVTGHEGLLEDPLESWVWRIEQAVLQAAAQIQYPLVVDRDKADAPPGGGPGRLVSVRAKAILQFVLPPLHRAMCYRTRQDSLWIEGPAQQPPETLEDVLAEAIDQEILRLIIMPELVALEPDFLDESDWLELDKHYTLGPINYRIDARGVRVELTVEMEAC